MSPTTIRATSRTRRCRSADCQRPAPGGLAGFESPEGALSTDPDHTAHGAPAAAIAVGVELRPSTSLTIRSMSLPWVSSASSALRLESLKQRQKGGALFVSERSEQLFSGGGVGSPPLLSVVASLTGGLEERRPAI
jgi:hypothetical protein